MSRRVGPLRGRRQRPQSDRKGSKELPFELPDPSKSPKAHPKAHPRILPGLKGSSRWHTMRPTMLKYNENMRFCTVFQIASERPWDPPTRNPKDVPRTPRAPHDASPGSSKTLPRPSEGHMRAPKDLPRAPQGPPWTLEEPPGTPQGPKESSGWHPMRPTMLKVP